MLGPSRIWRKRYIPVFCSIPIEVGGTQIVHEARPRAELWVTRYLCCMRAEKGFLFAKANDINDLRLAVRAY